MEHAVTRLLCSRIAMRRAICQRRNRNGRAVGKSMNEDASASDDRVSVRQSLLAAATAATAAGITAFRELGLLRRVLLRSAGRYRVIADGDGRLTVRSARIGKTRGALVQVTHTLLVALHDNALVLDHVIGVERDDVGDAECLAGNDQQIGALDVDVGDRRVADDEFGDRPRQTQDLAIDRSGRSDRWRGPAGPRPRGWP